MCRRTQTNGNIYVERFFFSVFTSTHIKHRRESKECVLVKDIFWPPDGQVCMATCGIGVRGCSGNPTPPTRCSVRASFFFFSSQTDAHTPAKDAKNCTTL